MVAGVTPTIPGNGVVGVQVYISGMGFAAQDALLQLILRNSAWANIGDSSGLQPSATAGSLYLSLHTASPGEGGNQSTNEISYT